MKVKICDLQPNPFRDFKNYPRDEEKIKILTESVSKTGFWDNILARKKNDKYEIAYGHHRYAVLKRLFKPEDIIDIPVKDLDDWTMIMIMIDENMEQYRTNPAVQNEGVKAAFEYLKKQVAFKQVVRAKKYAIVFDEIPIPEKISYTPLAAQIATQLGDIRKEKRIYTSLRQLEASGEIEIPRPKKPAEEAKVKETEEAKEETKIEEEEEKIEEVKVELSKLAMKILGRTSYVDRFFNTLQRLLKKKEIIIPKKNQIAVAKKLVSIAKFDSATMARELVKSVQKKKDDTKKEIVVELEEYLRESSNWVDKLNDRVKKMLEIKDVLDSEIYDKSVEKTEFKIKSVFLIRNLQKLLGGKNEARKLPNGRK